MLIKKHYKFSTLQHAWRKLYENNKHLTAYQSDKYAEIAFHYYLPYAIKLGVIPFFLEVLEDNETVMIIPLAKNMFKNEYSLFGDRSGYGYLDFIYSENIEEDTINKCFEKLKDMFKGSTLIFSRMREDSLICRYLLMDYEFVSKESCVKIDMESSYNQYYETLSKNTRQNIRTSYNRIQKEGKEINIKMFYKQSLPEKQLSDIIELYLKRRNKRYELSGGLISKIFLKNFDIGSVAMKKNDNYVHFILYIDDSIAAFYNGFLSLNEKIITVPRLAINDEFARFSPGILLLNESFKTIIDSNLAKEIDLMQGDEKYKYSMGGETHYCYQFKLKL